MQAIDCCGTARHHHSNSHVRICYNVIAGVVWLLLHFRYCVFALRVLVCYGCMYMRFHNILCIAAHRVASAAVLYTSAATSTNSLTGALTPQSASQSALDRSASRSPLPPLGAATPPAAEVASPYVLLLLLCVRVCVCASFVLLSVSGSGVRCGSVALSLIVCAFVFVPVCLCVCVSVCLCVCVPVCLCDQRVECNDHIEACLHATRRLPARFDVRIHTQTHVQIHTHA